MGTPQSSPHINSITKEEAQMNHGQLHTGVGETASKPADAAKNVDFLWRVKIPVRDGVQLNATVYKPKSTEPAPAIFILTPYIADTNHPRAYHFAQHGYAFALVDCRGRGNSEGH